ncbi:hypothetical protein R0135_11490 [Congregibacter variabilis]|uniref:DUF4124 domain-containing protein n=1 Tax=Congregibacter variabilis TaxID=3081200 RepID=A0ABZ0HZX8_9GAMM|nr:hypothetical protein R0135_11490 [Congregibacter sp. IMCC43200]
MMVFRSKFFLVGLIFFIGLMALQASAQSRQMYRYINAEGNKVVGYQVPPEFVANGYDILSATGALVAVVPRTLADGEREGLDSEARREREATEERERLRRWDESLLLRYSTIEDIEAARDRELRDLRIRVSILKGKLRSLKQQVENYQALAADQERLGNAVNVEHLSAIDDLQTEIAATERAVSDRQLEIATVEANYQKDMERFATLLDVVEMRNSMSAAEN